MIDSQTYRLRIGMFCVKSTSRLKLTRIKYEHDANALAIALICTLLVIGGIEMNPGPTRIDDCNQAGPSFADATLMDVMQAIRHTQIQIDELSSKVQVLTNIVKASIQHHGGELQRQQAPANDANAGCEVQQTDGKHGDELNREENNDISMKTGRTKIDARKYGAILIGSQNVARIRAAAMNEFVLDSNVSFVPTESDNAMQSLSNAMMRSKAKKIDVVLHTGADQVTERTADSVLESIASQISHAKQGPKTNQVFVCSVEERTDAGIIAHETAKTVNQELSNLCAVYRARFIDLRPRMTECRFSGINRTGSLYTFEAARNVCQEILGEVPGFLD